MDWMKPNILYEDNHLLVIYKPYNMPTQADKSGDLDLLSWGKQYIKQVYQKPGNVYLGLVHRLDRPVAGIVVFARTSKAAARLSEALKQRRIKKYYYAITRYEPKEKQAFLQHYLRKIMKTNYVKVSLRPQEKYLEAQLKYEWIAERKDLHLLRIMPITGRPHQIRVQLAAINCPILGDQKYGKGEEMLHYRGIALLAYAIQFDHPTKKIPLQISLPQFPPFIPWSYFHTLPQELISPFSTYEYP